MPDHVLTTQQAIQGVLEAHEQMSLWPEAGMAYEVVHEAAEVAVGKPRELRTPEQQQALELLLQIDQQRYSRRPNTGGGRWA